MADWLFGLETEYGLAFVDAGRAVYQMGQMEATQESFYALVKARHPHLCGYEVSGCFLPNGGRLYFDVGGHPEYATAECDNPTELVRHSLAGDRILTELVADRARQRGRGEEVNLFRANVCYASDETFGCHESYLHRKSPSAFPKQIIPFLVSRLIICGGGGLNPRSPSLEFCLSPRVMYLKRKISADSTDRRGIYHTKDEPLCGRGYHRLHILCGESLQSESAAWLRAGTTMLVVALIDAGLMPGRGVQLRCPLAAMRAFAADPTCTAKAEMLNNKGTTALALQRHYLAQAEAHMHDSFMPPWAETVCREWRAMLDRLEQGAPDSVATTLDWAIKYALYTQRLQSHQFSWESLRSYNHALDQACTELGSTLPHLDVLPNELIADAVFGHHGSQSNCVKRVLTYLQKEHLEPERLALLLQLRAELMEADTRFGQLSNGQGIFRVLDRAGVLHHHVEGVDHIEDAIVHPPAVGRARLRGECVRRFAADADGYACDWSSIWDFRKNLYLDLSEPFTTEEQWRPIPGPKADPPGDPILRTWSHHRDRRALDALLGLLERPRQLYGQPCGRHAATDRRMVQPAT